MAFKSINDTPRKSVYKKFITFNAQSGAIRISTEMRELSNKWEIEFDDESRQLRVKPSPDGFTFRGNCLGCHKAFVDSLGFDRKLTNIRFDLTLADDGWYYS